MLKKFYLLIIFSVTVVAGHAQQNLDVNFNGFGFFDNREYKAFIPRSRTYSGMRLALDVGFNLDSMNRFVVGVNGIHEFGAKPFFLKVDPVAYYNHHSKNWLFNAGMFPREGVLTDYPIAMLNDTLRYYRPNIEGLFVQFRNAHFSQNLWIDWVSRQTTIDREQFLFGFSGRYKPSIEGIFYLSHYFMMLHDAGASIPDPNHPLQDNGAAQIRLGLDITHYTGLDSLAFEAGGMASFERSNRVNGFRTPVGFVASLHAKYKRFEVRDAFYAGQGHHVLYGDSYYLKKIYNRLDIIYTPFLFKNIKGQFIFSFHQSPGYWNDNQQAFRIVADLGRKTIVRFKE